MLHLWIWFPHQMKLTEQVKRYSLSLSITRIQVLLLRGFFKGRWTGRGRKEKHILALPSQIELQVNERAYLTSGNLAMNTLQCCISIVHWGQFQNFAMHTMVLHILLKFTEIYWSVFRALMLHTYILLKFTEDFVMHIVTLHTYDLQRYTEDDSGPLSWSPRWISTF